MSRACILVHMWCVQRQYWVRDMQQLDVNTDSLILVEILVTSLNTPSKLTFDLALYHTQGPSLMINTHLSRQLPFAFSPYTARRSGAALTPSWSSRWRRPPARSSADYRTAQCTCGHGRHELTNTACRSFRVFLSGRHCTRHYMYTR